MNALGKISLFLSGAFLMLHTFLPHEHHTGLSAEEHFVQHESAHNLFDFIELAFHLDQGKDHLENFKVSDSSQSLFIAVAPILLFSLDRIVYEVPKIDFPLFDISPNESHLISKLRFRGPPSLG